MVAEVSRARLAALAGGAAGGLAEATDFCEREHTATFELNMRGRSLAEKTPARLVQEDGALQVVTTHGRVGEVITPNARALGGCLAIGFELVGIVDSIDLAAGTGRVAVEGRKARAA
ncbi:MAG: hypothetical protein M3320_00445 [Actinomycetota bacterium]|nr:hypothetical protein [Actinomycetota bacterium]MDQ5807123.1 hypothetical protein [Actinomycetota bacterium]